MAKFAGNGLVCLCGALLLCSPAHAQFSGSAGIVSDYLYRGVSLSAGQAAPRVAVNYDSVDGWYAGGQVVAARLDGAARRATQWMGYAGYAQQLPSGLSWEAGMTRYAFPQRPGWHFNELYGGVALDNLSVRLSYAPDYLGLRTRTWYGEASGGMDLPGGRLRAFWHLGYLGSIHAAPGAMIGRYDARLGLQAGWQDWRAELSFDAAHKRQTGGYNDIDARTTRQVVLSVGRTF
ncbi:MAG: TorF family putative porin [Burkholderiaceae bacterium]|nr:TorF family putative porin [Burkholderiaceae bacterium]